MKKSNFNDLMQRYLTNQVTEDERQKIESWLEVNKTGSSELDDLSEEEEEQLFSNITKGIIRKGRVKKRADTKWILRMAASIALLVTVGVTAYFLTDSLTTNNTVDKRVLNDGTLVWIKGESSLIYSESVDGTRNAELIGEALFEVAKDSSRPFKITHGNFTITVVGTSFNLKTSKDTLELKVLTGKVHVASFQDSLDLSLVAMQQLTYSEITGVKTKSVSQPEVKIIAALTEYEMQFKDEKLGEVLKRLERKFDTNIVTENSAAEKCRVTADLTDHSLETSLQMISEILPVKFEHVTNKKIFIKGEGCK